MYAVDSYGNVSANNATVQITLTDINDNSPQFSEDQYDFFFNQTQLGFVIGQVLLLFLQNLLNTIKDSVYYLGFPLFNIMLRGSAWHFDFLNSSPISRSKFAQLSRQRLSELTLQILNMLLRHNTTYTLYSINTVLMNVKELVIFTI